MPEPTHVSARDLLVILDETGDDLDTLKLMVQVGGGDPKEVSDVTRTHRLGKNAGCSLVLHVEGIPRPRSAVLPALGPGGKPSTEQKAQALDTAKAVNAPK